MFPYMRNFFQKERKDKIKHIEDDHGHFIFIHIF